MQENEDVRTLHKHVDLIRWISVLILLIHFYCCLYPAMREWGVYYSYTDKLIFALTKGLPVLSGVTMPKVTALVLLAVSLFGNRGKKDEKLTLAPILYYLIIGMVLYFVSSFFLNLQIKETELACLYITVTSLGYLSILAGGARFSRLLYLRLGKDVFNEIAETFPQEERLIENEHSINLPTKYNLKGKVRNGYINLTNPYRALLLAGVPGSQASLIMSYGTS